MSLISYEKLEGIKNTHQSFAAGPLEAREPLTLRMALGCCLPGPIKRGAMNHYLYIRYLRGVGDVKKYKLYAANYWVLQ